MSEILFQYRKIDPTTWVYLSSLLIISVFFKFNRFWSVRNLDLVLLILLAPGLLMVNQSRQALADAEAVEAVVETLDEVDTAPAGLAARKDSLRNTQFFGYAWLLGVSAVWLVRLLADPTMIRRPLLEPNLS